MGHCDNCQKEILTWQSNEIIIIVNSTPVQVQRYCNDCTELLMNGPLKLPRPETVTEEPTQ